MQANPWRRARLTGRGPPPQLKDDPAFFTRNCASAPTQKKDAACSGRGMYSHPQRPKRYDRRSSGSSGTCRPRSMMPTGTWSVLAFWSTSQTGAQNLRGSELTPSPTSSDCALPSAIADHAGSLGAPRALWGSNSPTLSMATAARAAGLRSRNRPRPECIRRMARAAMSL